MADAKLNLDSWYCNTCLVIFHEDPITWCLVSQNYDNVNVYSLFLPCQQIMCHIFNYHAKCVIYFWPISVNFHWAISAPIISRHSRWIISKRELHSSCAEIQPFEQRRGIMSARQRTWVTIVTHVYCHNSHNSDSRESLLWAISHNLITISNKNFSHAPLISVMLHWFRPLISVMLHWLQSTDISHAPLISVHWFQSCSTDFSHAPLISVMLHWFQSCSTDFSHAPLISVMLHWFQLCSTDFSHAPLISVMLQWFQSCSTDFSHAPLISVMLHWFQWTEINGAWLKSMEHDWN